MRASTFGERLAFALWWRMGLIRREKASELAALLGVTDGLLTQWRDREEPVSSAQGTAIAKLCEVPYDWLMRGEGADVPAPELFARFLPVHRDWVKRGGNRKSITKTATKTSSKEIAEQERRKRRSAG